MTEMTPPAFDQKYDFVRALSSTMSPKEIAAQTGINVRQIRKILKRGVDRPAGRPTVLTPEACTHLIQLQQSGTVCWDWQYSYELATLGCPMSRSSVQSFFSRLGSKFVKIKPREADKYTNSNLTN